MASNVLLLLLVGVLGSIVVFDLGRTSGIRSERRQRRPTLEPLSEQDRKDYTEMMNQLSSVLTGEDEYDKALEASQCHNWASGWAICRVCSWRWVSVRPACTDPLECPACHELAGEAAQKEEV